MQAAPRTEVLTEEKIAEIREIFTLFDKDNDGFVRIEDLGIMIRATGANPSDAEVDTLKGEIDPGNTGKFDQNSFMSTVAKRPADTETIEDVIDALVIISRERSDADKVTDINEGLFEYCMTGKGEAIPANEVKEVIKDWDITYDQSLNIEELAKILMTK